ncbi:restriction endonuclease subunit S [Lunatimonas lonarensis]|nr:restriction endonuclease subunit S [Lunatimonas lonarensis]
MRHGKDQKQVQSSNGLYPILGTGGLMGYANNYLYNKPSVLIGRKGTIDKPQYMETPFWTVDTLFYSEISENYSARFIFYLFQQIEWKSFNEASGVPSLNAKTIENIEVSFPSFGEQNRIAKVIYDFEKEIKLTDSKLQKLKLQKQGMMQALLTGKIRLV